MDGNPIDDLIKTNQKLSGITFTPEEIEEMKSSYNGDPELAFQDMVNTVQKARNIKFTYNERLDMKAKYGVPMAWVDIMALSENPDLNPTQKNKAGESSAAGYWQVTKSAHEPTIRKMFGVSHADFIKDPNKQERYVKETLEPVYDKNLSEFRDTAEEGIKEGRFKDYEKYMVNGRFTDDQIKAMNHVLGSSGARYFLNNGSFIGVEQDRKARDIRRTLQQMIGLRKQYGVPTSLQDQYNFSDVVKQAAEEVTAASTPTLGGGQASVQKGPKIAGQSTDIDWGAGTVTTKFDKKQIKAEAKKKTTTTTPQGQPQFGVGRSVVDLQVTDKGESIQNADEVFKSGAPNERKIKENAWLENTAKAKEITSDFSQYKDKKVDPTNLNDEELKLRDEIQQKLRAEKEVLNSSQYMLRDKYGANVEKDIQDLLSNQSAVIDDISNLEKTIKDKYQGKTPSNADIAPLTKKRAELGDNIRDLVVQQNALNAKAEELNNKLKEFGERPGITEEEYNRYYNEINREFANISNQFDALGADIGRLNQDYEKIRLQEQSLIEKYNEEASNINSQYAADSDVQKLKTKLGEYNKNLGRIQKYQEDPFFNSYLDSLYNITDLGKSYKNLFPDVLEGEERSKELAKLARDIVKKEKTEYWSPQNIFIDLYNGVKSLYTDAPATGVFSTLLNSLKTASYNIAGDFIGAAASISDAVGAEDIARKLRVGDLYEANVTRMNIEQDVTRSAVRSDIQGNPVEEYYTVKDSDDVLFSTGLQPGDRIIVEDGKPVAYRGEDGFKKNLNLIPGTNPDKIVEDFVKSKPTEEVFSLVRTVTSSLPSIIDMASLIGFNYAAMPRISRLFAKAGTRSAAGLAANFGMQTFQQYGDLYSSYLQKGLSPGDAAKYALGQSAGVALIELFNPLEMKVASLGGDAAVNSFRKIIDTSVDLFARGKIGTKDLLANIGIGAATALKEAGIEGGTELIQGEFENIVENYATNGNKSTSMNDSFNTLATTLAVVFLPSISMGGAAYRNAKSDVITSSIFKAAQNKEQFLKDLDKAVENGKLEISEAAGIKNYVEYIKDELDEYGTITDNQGAALTGLIGTRYYYENKKKTTSNETAKKEIDKKIEEINKTIQDVVSGAKKPEVDPFVAEFVGEKGKDKEAPAKEDINTKKAYDFDDTLFDNKTGKLTKLGEDVKKRIEAGEDIVIVTARGENQTQQIQDVLGIGADKIEATGDEAKKPEALQKRGISPQEYYDENQEKLAAIQGKAAPSTTAAGAMKKEQQAELDKVSKRAERIQRTLQEDAALQEEGDEPMLSPEQKTKLETELQTLNQRKDAIQKQSTAEVPIQPGAQTREGVGGQVQAEPQVTTGEGKGKGKGKGKAEGKVQEQINDKEFKDFVDKNVVTPARIESISNKVINNETLSPREQQVFTSRTTDVNKKIEEIAAAQKQAPQATKAAEPTPTTTTTEKVAPEAGKAPQKANTVQGFELTKKDGTKAAPAEYRKNEKGNWGKVNAKGGVTPVSSPAQVKELENALSSQAAAPKVKMPALKETDKTTEQSGTKYTLAEDLTVHKGTKGKRNIDGTLRTAHPNAKGSFTAADIKIAERYKGDGTIISTTLPAGTTVEVVKVDLGNIPASQYRDLETEAINSSDADVVKLITMDAKLIESQYVIRNQKLRDELRKKGDLEKTAADVEAEAATPSQSAAEGKAAPTTQQEDVANELAKANNISKTQAKTISAVINTVKKNIAKRLGISLPEYRRRTAIRVVPNLQGIIKDFPNSLSSLRGLSSELINDFTGATQELKVAFQDAFGKVDAKFIKNNGIDNNDFILSSVLTLDNNGYFDFLGKGKKLSSMKKEAIQEELNKRLSDILDRAKNTNDFYIKEFSESWLKEGLKRAATENEKDIYQAMLDGDENVIQQQLENIQSQQRANLLASLNYLIPSKDYSPEFKYAVVSMALKGAQAKPITIKGKVVEGKLAKRNDQTVGNHQELSSMVLPNVYVEMQRGSGSHPMELIDKHTDKSIIGRDETWELVKDRVFKKSDGGYWIKFEKSNEDSDIQALTLVSKKVQKVMSADDNPWCTGGGMAANYLPKGDFYLFLDENLDPQITVRYEEDRIAEVKGTDRGQALSESQANTAEKFLDDIPNGKDYKNQVKASKVYHRLKNDIPPTTKQDLQDFFDVLYVDLETYDVDKEDEFTELKDDNLREYISYNDEIKLYDDIIASDDINLITVPNAFAKKFPNLPILNKNVLVIGDLKYSNIKGQTIPKSLRVIGNLDLTGQDLPQGFTLPENLRVEGDLSFWGATLPQGFTLPKGLQVDRDLNFNGATLPQGFTLPKDLQVGWMLNFGGATLSQGFTLPESLQVGGILNFGGVTLPQDFKLPEGLQVEEDLNFGGAILPQDFTLPKGLRVKGNLIFVEATLPQGFTLPKDLQVGGFLPHANVKYADGFPANSIFTDWLRNRKIASMAQQDSRGAIVETPTSTIILLDKDNADVTTPIHEIAHEYEKVLTADERKVMEDWSGAKFGTTKFREAFAKGAERYLYEGATFNGKVDAVFEKLKNWFKNVITDAINYFGDINQLTPEVREIYSKMLIDGDMDVVEVTAPPQVAAEGKDRGETATPPMETVLEQIGSTKAKITDQIYRFFTKAAAQNDAEAKEMAKLTFAIWERVGQYFGGKNGTDWIKSKIQSLGRTSATQAGKLGEVRLQSPTVQAAELAEAAERVANNIVEHIDSLIAKGRKVLAAEKDKAERKRIQQSLQSLKDTKEQVQKARKDPRFQVDAYHGTPYVFDKFSTEKIGTGEGAQAFGWGLYFTDLENIARGYAKKLAGDEYSYDGKLISKDAYDYLFLADKSFGENFNENTIKDLAKIAIDKINNEYIPDLKEIAKTSRSEKQRSEMPNEIKRLEGVIKELQNIIASKEIKKAENKILYKTNLFQGKKPGEYTLLEWDKRIDDDTFNKIKNAIEDKYGRKLEDYDGTPILDLINLPAVRGGTAMYKTLSRALKGDKNASLFLLEAGIDGIKYPAESIARGTTSDTARGFNYVIFDENDVAIKERVQFQQEAAEFRAATIALANNKFIVAALENPNASSFVHEEFHTFEDSLSAAERQTLLDSYNENFGEKETEWTTDVSEWGARLWEKYFSNGRKLTEAEVKDKATRTKLQEIFDKFTEYLKGIYDGVIQYTNSKGATKEVNISPEVQALFDKIMGITPTAAETKDKAETKTAEQLSEDIQASIEAETAKEKMQTKDPVQMAGQDLVNNPESASSIPDDVAAALLEYAEGLKINLGGFKKICK